MHSLIADHMRDGLIWLPELGIGYVQIREQKADYFDHYRSMRDTEIARKLNEFRVAFVNRHTMGAVIDCGVGDGAFILHRRKTAPPLKCGTFGYDIDPKAVEWLKSNGFYSDFFSVGRRGPSNATFWDVLEHLDRPDLYLARVESHLFASMPIYESGEAVLRSKHFKPAEHRWYFTDSGFRDFMSRNGFRCIEQSDEETAIGRDSIRSYAFIRCHRPLQPCGGHEQSNSSS